MTTIHYKRDDITVTVGPYFQDGRCKSRIVSAVKVIDGKAMQASCKLVGRCHPGKKKEAIRWVIDQIKRKEAERCS